MRLHETHNNFHVCFDKTSVDLDGDSTLRRPQRDVITVISGEVILDPDVFHDPGVANDLGELFPFIGSIEPGGNENRYVLTPDPG